MEIRKEIFKYLREKGILKQFINNCLSSYRAHPDRHRPITSIVCPEKIDLIMDSFTWSETEERYDFWSRQYNDYIKWKKDLNI